MTAPARHDFDLNPPWQTGEGLTLNSLQCPTAGFCAGIVNYAYADDDTDDFDYDVVVSSNPAGGA